MANVWGRSLFLGHSCTQITLNCPFLALILHPGGTLRAKMTTRQIVNPSKINIWVNRTGSANLFYYSLKHQLIFEQIIVGHGIPSRQPMGPLTQLVWVASAYSDTKQWVYTSVNMTRNPKANIFHEPSSWWPGRMGSHHPPGGSAGPGWKRSCFVLKKNCASKIKTISFSPGTSTAT